MDKRSLCVAEVGRWPRKDDERPPRRRPSQAIQSPSREPGRALSARTLQFEWQPSLVSETRTFRFPAPTMVYAKPRQSHTILPHLVQRHSHSSPGPHNGRSLPVITHLCFLSGLAGHMWPLPILPHPPEMPSNCSSVSSTPFSWKRNRASSPRGAGLSWSHAWAAPRQIVYPSSRTLRRHHLKRVRVCWNSSERFCRYSAGRGCLSLRRPFTGMRSCDTAQFG